MCISFYFSNLFLEQMGSISMQDTQTTTEVNNAYNRNRRNCKINELEFKFDEIPSFFPHLHNKNFYTFFTLGA